MSRARKILDSSRRCALSVMADFAEQPLEKTSINSLLHLHTFTPEDRVRHLHETLKVGLAKCSLRLSGMPFGFCNQPSIRKVTAAYTQNFRQVMEFEHSRGMTSLSDTDLQDYSEMTKVIFNKHRGTMLDVAKGVFEFYEDLERMFGRVELAEVRQDLRLIKDIEDSLDMFFTDRLTLRLLISHVSSLNSGKVSKNPDMVGVVHTCVQPIQILERAYASCKFICMRDYNVAPELVVNGTSVDDFLADSASEKHCFPYVHTQLFYIFLELLKNAARASIERGQMEAGVSGDVVDGVFRANSASSSESLPLKIPPIRIVVPESQAMWDVERAVKLADSGTGMSRIVLNKAFCYFFSSVENRPTVADEVSDFDRNNPLAGFGFGLPISRVMARYFHGDIDLNSIAGKGTDVYVYL